MRTRNDSDCSFINPVQNNGHPSDHGQLTLGVGAVWDHTAGHNRTGHTNQSPYIVSILASKRTSFVTLSSPNTIQTQYNPNNTMSLGYYYLIQRNATFSVNLRFNIVSFDAGRKELGSYVPNNE